MDSLCWMFKSIYTWEEAIIKSNYKRMTLQMPSDISEENTAETESLKWMNILANKIYLSHINERYAKITVSSQKIISYIRSVVFSPADFVLVFAAMRFDAIPAYFFTFNFEHHSSYELRLPPKYIFGKVAHYVDHDQAFIMCVSVCVFCFFLPNNAL